MEQMKRDEEVAKAKLEAGIAVQSDAGHSSQDGELLSGRLEDDDYVKGVAGAMRDAPTGYTSTETQYLRIYREAEGGLDRIIQKVRATGIPDEDEEWEWAKLIADFDSVREEAAIAAEDARKRGNEAFKKF
ncbi:hypothetical protein DL771_011605 [Monosporascus sp. 5C6A]|nr:hypothetical protein DL771_011605 [Monosporascus sp. 5C6A]